MSDYYLFKIGAVFLLCLPLACGQRSNAAGPVAEGHTPEVVASPQSSASLSTAEDLKAVCLGAARACARYVISGDYDGVVNCMPEETVEMLGGHSAVVEVARKGMAEMARSGAHLEMSLIEPPTRVARGEKRTFAILPQVVVVRVPKGRLRQRTFLLAVSPDDGHKWRFMDGVELNGELAKKLFPDFPSSLTLPRVEQPELVASDR